MTKCSIKNLSKRKCLTDACFLFLIMHLKDIMLQVSIGEKRNRIGYIFPFHLIFFAFHSFLFSLSFSLSFFSLSFFFSFFFVFLSLSFFSLFFFVFLSFFFLSHLSFSFIFLLIISYYHSSPGIWPNWIRKDLHNGYGRSLL